MEKNYNLPDDKIILSKLKEIDLRDEDKIHLFYEGLLKQVSGFYCGLTLRGILFELNLIKENGKPTAYGYRCIYYAYMKLTGNNIEREYQYDKYLSPFEGVKFTKTISECFVTGEVLEEELKRNN